MATLQRINEILAVLRSLPQSWLALNAQAAVDAVVASERGWDARRTSFLLTGAVLDAVMLDLMVLEHLHVSTATEARQYDPPIQQIAFEGGSLTSEWELTEEVPPELEDFRRALWAALVDDNRLGHDEIALCARWSRRRCADP